MTIAGYHFLVNIKRGAVPKERIIWGKPAAAGRENEMHLCQFVCVNVCVYVCVYWCG